MADPTFLIVTTMKNEGPFILEWIAWNRVIGVNDFLIFTNDCSDGTDRIAMRLEELGLATHVKNRLKAGQSPQRKALRRAWKHPKVQAADWLICADVDEFLNVRTGEGRLPDLLAAVGEVDAISVCWKLFGNSGRQTFKRGFVTEQFQRAAPEKRFSNFRARGMKTLFRREGPFTRFGIHRPKVDPEAKAPVWVDAGGKPAPDSIATEGWSTWKGFSHDHARLHHYAVRSVDSFLVKRDRGRTNHVNSDQGLEYWTAMNTNQAEDTSILPRLDALRAEYERLLADPELARMHRRACRWHKKKIAELRSREGWDEFRDRITAITGGAPVIASADAKGEAEDMAEADLDIGDDLDAGFDLDGAAGDFDAGDEIAEDDALDMLTGEDVDLDAVEDVGPDAQPDEAARVERRAARRARAAVPAEPEAEDVVT